MEATREVPPDAVVAPVVDYDLAPPATVSPIPGEVWRPLDSHPGYLVSSFGRVAHQKRGLARPWQKPDQAVVYVSIGGHNLVVHELAAFLGPKPADPLRPASLRSGYSGGLQKASRLRSSSMGTLAADRLRDRRPVTGVRGIL